MYFVNKKIGNKLQPNPSKEFVANMRARHIYNDPQGKSISIGNGKAREKGINRSFRLWVLQTHTRRRLGKGVGVRESNVCVHERCAHRL